MKDETISIHGHEFYDEKHGSFIVPIFQSSTFEQYVRTTGEARKTDRGTDLKYSREENPTVRYLEKILAKLDAGEDALCYSSGMAAISSIFLSFLKKGDTILISKEAYGTTIQLALELKKFGINTVLVTPNTEKLIEELKPAKFLFIETMTNPTLKVLNIPEIAKACKEMNIKLIVDNTFVTPILYKPLKDNVDLVVHSATKYLAGHNDVISGVVIGNKEEINFLWDWRRKLGSILAPFEAFLVIRGLKTLELRMRKHCKNAKAIAEFLCEHPKVKEVLYPGLPDNEYHNIAKRLFSNKGYGGVVSFRIKGSLKEALRVLMSTRIIKPAPSFGGAESLITCPMLSAASKMPKEIREELGITENLLRLSVGLENIDDLIEDLDNALKSI